MNKLAKFILIVILLYSCGQVDNHTNQLSVLEDNKELIKSFIKATDAKQFNSYAQFLTNDVVAHFPGADVIGLEAVTQGERSFAVAFPDASRIIEDLVAEGDKVVLRETFTGTHNGDFNGLAPTGRTVNVGAVVIYRISNGKIAESWVQADFVGLMNQLTAEDPSSNQ